MKLDTLWYKVCLDGDGVSISVFFTWEIVIFDVWQQLFFFFFCNVFVQRWIAQPVLALIDSN